MKRFKSWRELRIGQVVYFSSHHDGSRLFEWVILDINREEMSITVNFADGKRHRRVGPAGTKLFSIDHFVKTGELRKLP